MQGCWSPAQAWGFWFHRHMLPEEEKVCMDHRSVAGLNEASLSASTWLYEVFRKATSGGLILSGL